MELCQILHRESGIDLGSDKKDLMINRVNPILKERDIELSDFLMSLKSGDKEATHVFVNSLTTNKTFFFREPKQFNHIREVCKQRPSYHVFYVWSAACSTGQEAYTLSMCLKEACFPKGQEFRILATDIDSNVLKKAESGIYEKYELDGLSDDQIKNNFLVSNSGDKYKVNPGLQDHVKFRQLNLIDDKAQIPVKFDFIFLRNVLIYFNEETQQQIMDRLYEKLNPGGILYLGASETIRDRHGIWKSLGMAAYQKEVA